VFFFRRSEKKMKVLMTFGVIPEKKSIHT